MSAAINLGDKVKDSLSGTEGIVICRSDWLFGCTRFGVQSQGVNKDGQPHKVEYFDEPQLTVVSRGEFTPAQYVLFGTKGRTAEGNRPQSQPGPEAVRTGGPDRPEPPARIPG